MILINQNPDFCKAEINQCASLSADRQAFNQCHPCAITHLSIAEVDSLTHIALGACLGEAMAGKKLGKRAMLIGAVVHSLPDIDVTAVLWMSTPESLLAHRGFTHSFLFVALITPVLAFIAARWNRNKPLSYKRWIIITALLLLAHLFVDATNVYGVAWWEPFSHHRVMWNWVFVFDPLYSLWLVLALIALMLLRKNSPARRRWVRIGIGISSFYLLTCGLIKYKIDSDVRSILKKQQVAYNDYFTTPAPMNNLLWFVVAASDSGFHIGYRSLFDQEKKMDFHFVLRNESLLKPWQQDEDVQRLKRFSQGFYTASLQGDTVLFNDLRFGQMNGWKDKAAPFVFYYYVQYPKSNRYVLQRGRFKGWDRETFLSLLRRMGGKQ